MSNQHPIIPPPIVREQWFDDAVRLNSTPKYYIARQAALWGADQQLEACCEWLFMNGYDNSHVTSARLRAARRPKPPTLKEQALEALEALPTPAGQVTADRLDTIRRALEQLDD